MSDSPKIGFRLTPPKNGPKLKLKRSADDEARVAEEVRVPPDIYTEEPKTTATSKPFKLSPSKLIPTLRKTLKPSAPKTPDESEDGSIEVDSIDIIAEGILPDQGEQGSISAASWASVSERSRSGGAAVRSTGGWGPAIPKAKHLTLAAPPREQLDDDSRVRLAEILDDYGFSFHELIDGEVPNNIIAEILRTARRIHGGTIDELKDFIGDNLPLARFIIPYGNNLYHFPSNEQAEKIAHKLGWSTDAFKDAIAAAQMKQEELNENGRIEDHLWSRNVNLMRLYRLLRLGEKHKVIFQAGQYLEVMLKDQPYQDRIAPEHVVELYGKGVSVKFDDFIDAANVLEVILNATWGESEGVVVPREIKENKFSYWPPSEDWYKNKENHIELVGKSLAEAAFNRMRGDDQNDLGAAIMYAALTEDHFYDAEVKEGRYDFYNREEARAVAISDMRQSPERYADEKLAKEALTELFTGNQLESLLSEIDSAKDFLEPERKLFSKMEIDTSWIKNGERWHHARRFLYGFVAIGRFVQAAIFMEEDDPAAALNCYGSARLLLGRYIRRRELLYAFKPEELGIDLKTIVQPLRFEINKLNRALDRKIADLSKQVNPGDDNSSSGQASVGNGSPPRKAPPVNPGTGLRSILNAGILSLRWYLNSPLRA